MAEVTTREDQLRVAADQARADSRELRLALASRRLELRRSINTMRSSQRESLTTMRWLGQKRELRLRSAWSDLPWILLPEEFRDVLVRHDGTP